MYHNNIYNTCFICVLFARNDKFKEKAKKNVIIEKPYESPTIISVKEKNK